MELDYNMRVYAIDVKNVDSALEPAGSQGCSSLSFDPHAATAMIHGTSKVIIGVTFLTFYLLRLQQQCTSVLPPPFRHRGKQRTERRAPGCPRCSPSVLRNGSTSILENKKW